MAAARVVPALISIVAIAAGCGAQGGGTSPGAPGESPFTRSAASAMLEISVRDGRGEASEATVRCSPGSDRLTGYLRLEQAADLCRRLGELTAPLTSPPPRGRACAEVYGGPATARIRGRLEDRPVDRRLARTDACEIAEWNRLDSLLPDIE